MKGFRYYVLNSLLIAGISTANASDPVTWSMSGSLPSQTSLNQTYSYFYTFTNKMPFTMPTPLYISVNPSSSEFATTDACSGQKLATNASCHVSVVFTPKSSGSKTYAIAMEYGKNKVPLPTLTTQTSSPQSQIQGVVSVPFPSSILSSTTYYISFTYTNNGSTTASNVSVSANSGNTSGFTLVSNNCGSTLTSGSSCTVTGSFNTASTSGAVSEGYTLSSSIGSASATTSTVVNNTTGATVRNFTFINKCSVPVYIGINGGAMANSPSCSDDSGCPNGTHCDTSNSLCYYANPTPIDGQYTLAANGGTNTAVITDYSNLPAVWSHNYC